MAGESAGLAGGRPRIFKSPKPLYRDRTQVRKAIKQPKGNILVGHVRWASNPLKLSRKELIGTTHTQPFTHGRWMFAHNGTLLDPAGSPGRARALGKIREGSE